MFNFSFKIFFEIENIKDFYFKSIFILIFNNLTDYLTSKKIFNITVIIYL